MHLTQCTPADLIKTLDTITPDAAEALTRLQAVRSQLLPYQQRLLFHLAQQYDKPYANFLEIGTFHGHSAMTMALAAPQAHIITLNPNADEYRQTLDHLIRHQIYNVIAQCIASWDYYEQDILYYDLIFVDGDHARVQRDLVWWKRLKPHGLMLFHDYSPAESKHPSPRVFEAVNQMAERLGKEGPDVLVVDTDLVGMAGFYKRVAGE